MPMPEVTAEAFPDVVEAFRKLREAGGDIYDHIDVDEYMRFQRDDDYKDEDWTCGCGKVLDKYFWRCPDDAT